MVKTIDEGFRTFHSRLTPSKTESDAAKNHRASINDTLKRNFEIISFFRSGSFGNGTSIRGYSDVDYFAHIPMNKVKENSSIMLSDFRDVLDSRFPRTGVRVNNPAVLVPFGTDVSESTEIVPAKTIRNDEKVGFIYGISDGSGNWIESAPKAHNDHINSINDKLDKKVKPIIRFLKAWKYFKNVPISSFYLELFVADYVSGRTTLWYSIDVHGIINKLNDLKLPDIDDPLGVGDKIAPCSTSAKRIDSLSKLGTANVRAKLARESEKEGKIKDAFYYWNVLFDGKFPKYE